MAISAQTANERARQLLTLTERLAMRLEAETLALEAHRPQDIHEVVEETRGLSALYRQETQRVKADPQLLAGIGAAEKAALKAATERFMVISQRHAHAVAAAKTVSEGIMQAIAEEISDKRKPSLTYGPQATTKDRAPHSLNYGFKA